jgi:hypothetical protein
MDGWLGGWRRRGTYPKVLPEPVLAMATTSRPVRATDQLCAWMGVGPAKPALRTSTMMSSGMRACGSEGSG